VCKCVSVKYKVKRRKLRIVFVYGGFLLSTAYFLLSTALWAQEITAVPEAVQAAPREVSADAVFSQKITLDLRNIDIIDALKYLTSKTGLNIIFTKNVSGRVSLMVENVLIKDVFDVMLRSNGLAYMQQGNICNVMTEVEYKAFYGSNFYDMRQVKMMRLKYAIPEQAFSLLDALKSDIGRVLVEPESGNVLIMDTPERIQRMQTALEEFEKVNMVRVFTLKYAKAKEVEDILKTQLDSKKVGFVKADERNNQLIVQTLSERMQEIEALIRSLDKQTKEVIIDTKIVKIKLTDQLDSGFEWEGIFQVAKNHGVNYLGSTPFSVIQKSTDTWQTRDKFLETTMSGGIGAYPFSGTTSDFASSTKKVLGEEMHYGIVQDKRDFDIFFKYLQTLGKTRILSNPKLAVVNNQEAKIHIGERQAYTTSTTTAGQTTSTISEEVTFVDVGIQLALTAVINDDGFITLKVKPEVSSVTSSLTTPTGNKIPIIDTSLTETTVMMKDNTTLIVGGLRKEEKTSSSEGVPFLSKIPLIGFIFSSKTGKTDRTELLVMLTPHIISGDELSTGNERAFGDKPGKEYRGYDTIAPRYTTTPQEEQPLALQELPAGSEIKPYRDIKDVSGSDEKFAIKEEKPYESF